MPLTVPTFRVWFQHYKLSFLVRGSGASPEAAMADAELRAELKVSERELASRQCKGRYARAQDKRASIRGGW